MQTVPVVIALAACGVLIAGNHVGPDAPALPYVQWAGSESAHEPGFVLVSDQQEWLKLWGQHTGSDHLPGDAFNRHAAPEVNFERCVVVAYFRGSAVNEDGETVSEVDDLGDRVRVRFSSDSFQTASFSGEDQGVATKPFGIWVLPATSKAVVVEEGSADLKDQPLQWREVHRFGAR